MSKNILKNLKFIRLDLLEKIPFNPLPQYSKEESLTETENDISLFSISILFSLKNSTISLGGLLLKFIFFGSASI